MRPRRSVLPLALASIAAVAAGPVEAQDPLPDAAQLINRYLEARGGRDAVLASAGERIRGVVALPAMGVEGAIEIIMLDGRTVTTLDIPGLGESRTGYDGKGGWSVDDMMGPRLLEGRELDAIRETADPLAEVRDVSLFAARETVTQSEMDGERCWLVRLEWLSGRETLECYHVDTGLAVATIETQESPMGSVEVTTYLDEYGEFHGALRPVRSRQEVMGQWMSMRIDEVLRGDVDPSELDPPMAIQELRDR